MNRRPNALLAALALLLALAIPFIPASYAPVRAESALAAQPEATAAPAPAAGESGEATPQNLTADDIRGEAAILIDADTGSVLFEKNANEKLYPASTTKIMTALLALEYGHLDDTVTVPKSIAKLPKDSSLVPLKPGEKLTMRDLLYGLMICSGNDAAVTIATKVAGSVGAFVKMMNEKAEALGCTQTQFKNPHGYQNKAHYTTARDLALIAREAMKDETFRQIVSAASYTMPKTNKSKQRKLTSTDLMLIDSSPYYYPYEIGVKTGHHSKSGQCFVGAAVKDGVTLISVTLKSTTSGMWKDTRKLMDYGFAQYASASPTPAPAANG